MSASIPEPSRDPLERPATRQLVVRLTADGYLDPAAGDAALRALRPSRAWWWWTNRLLLGLGAALMLAGVIFFFAFNWTEIPPLGKVFISQGVVVLLAAGAWWRGFDSPPGRALLIGASVAVGAMLAVFGQVYQTGADAYELFVGWAALTAGWTVVSAFAGHWLLWLAIVDLAIWLYWAQVLEPAGASSWEIGMIALAVVNTVALAANEYVSKREWWSGTLWGRWVVWCSVLAFLAIPSTTYIVDLPRAARVEPLLALAAVLAVGYWYFRHRARDLLALTLGALALCVVVLTAARRVIFDAELEELALLGFGCVVLVVFGIAALWLRRIGEAITREQQNVA